MSLGGSFCEGAEEVGDVVVMLHKPRYKHTDIVDRKLTNEGGQ